MLYKYTTQNIDNLEESAGFKVDDIVQAHGANNGAVCSKCDEEQDRDKLVEMISKGEVMRCSDADCNGPVKPKITFFGEALPAKFINTFMEVQQSKPDLTIVIGTALAVGPYNNLVEVGGDDIPKVLINLQPTEFHNFQDPKHPNRLFLQGKCDDIVKELVTKLQWENEFNEYIS